MTLTQFLILFALGCLAMAVIFAACCVVLGRDNDRLRRVKWSRVKTAIRLRTLRRLQRELEDYINADEAEEVAGQHWSMQ